ncbi:nudix hydrolase 2 [Scaptodrosophila lebanonensis]|uniref:Nudix hydrolase 2 n=1 Tax=Drosophila lebanonensis TaxID=7225 RepID=A0A6J2U0L7_DROLE|nr:nudix hydrolase 2 [Scaptodrosophila lebanonensis]XP_030381900.1 nudix hydrolase 2 [Scaptodrosophila lebanonensis]XP_030381901.1 nudix hydrolase 2 [Scaptodrosophila lebanonensis]
MSSTALLCRRHCFKFRVFNSWRTRLQRQEQHHQQQLSVRATATAATQLPRGGRKQVSAQLQIVRPYKAFEPMDAPKEVFQGKTDRFKGVTVDCKDECLTNAQFQEKLQKSVDFWSTNGNRAIWFYVYKNQAEWVPILAEAGFDFHHARTGVVAMYRWLPKDESSNLPNYAHTLLGVGGLVINDNDEVLVVSDRYAMIPNSWKLPGGYVEPRENLIDAAIREVCEETGIQTTFKSVVCLRHSHGGNFGCSDIYMVVGLKPLNLDFKRCEREIARLQWMPIQEYLEHPQVHETNRHFVRTYLDYQRRGLVLTCRCEVHQVLKKEYNLYFVDQHTPQSTSNEATK